MLAHPKPTIPTPATQTHHNPRWQTQTHHNPRRQIQTHATESHGNHPNPPYPRKPTPTPANPNPRHRISWQPPKTQTHTTESHGNHPKHKPTPPQSQTANPQPPTHQNDAVLKQPPPQIGLPPIREREQSREPLLT
jgi:hypothetical protein